MIFVQSDTHGLSARAATAYRALLEANERHVRAPNPRPAWSRPRRAVPLAVLVLDEHDCMVTEALDLPPGSTIVVRPDRMRSSNGALAVLTYAYLLGAPLLVDFTSGGVELDLSRFDFEVVRMDYDPTSRRIFPVLELEDAA